MENPQQQSTNMPSSKHRNYYYIWIHNYGFLGVFVMIVSWAAFYVLRSSACSPHHYELLETIQQAGAITGFILFVLSFFNISNFKFKTKIAFYAVIIAILGMAGVLFLGAYIAFAKPCLRNAPAVKSAIIGKNAFDVEDGYGIALMVMDIVCGLMLLSIGGIFIKRL